MILCTASVCSTNYFLFPESVTCLIIPRWGSFLIRVIISLPRFGKFSQNCDGFIKKLLYPYSFPRMDGRPLYLLQKHVWLLLKRPLHCGKQICFGKKMAVCKEAFCVTLELSASRRFSWLRIVLLWPKETEFMEQAIFWSLSAV